MRGTVTVQLTNGFGNNLFQYVAARQLSEFLGSELFVLPFSSDYYAIPDLARLGISCTKNIKARDLIRISDYNYPRSFDNSLRGKDLFLSGYFENYKYYYHNLDKIKSWFPSVKKRNDNDLVLHMRTGDRLFFKNEFHTKPRIQNYLSAIENFNFENLHVVTDMPMWSTVTEDELKMMKFHHNVPTNERVPIKESVTYINEIIKGLERYNPRIQKRTIAEDFNFIRSFNNILFEHGTLSWWASVLSQASKVGVYGPWRPWKGDSNKNLSNIPLDGWFKWK